MDIPANAEYNLVEMVPTGDDLYREFCEVFRNDDSLPEDEMAPAASPEDVRAALAFQERVYGYAGSRPFDLRVPLNTLPQRRAFMFWLQSDVTRVAAAVVPGFSDALSAALSN